MNELQIFENPEFGKIRAIERNGEPWFVAADVCRALDLCDTSKALDRLDDDEKGTSLIRTLGGEQKMNIVNEPGLYTLVLGSRKPEAKAFKRWITHEVIPSIRKHGAYLSPEIMDKLDALTRRVDYLANAMPAVSWPPIQPEVSLTGLAKVITITRRVMLDMGSSPEQVGEVTRNILNTCGFRLPDFKKRAAQLLELIDFF